MHAQVEGKKVFFYSSCVRPHKNLLSRPAAYYLLSQDTLPLPLGQTKAYFREAALRIPNRINFKFESGLYIISKSSLSGRFRAVLQSAP